MFSSPKLWNKSAIAKALAAGVLVAASAGAQANVIYAGSTNPTGAPAATRVDGMVFYAVFQLGGSNATANDPWGTGYTSLTTAAVAGLYKDGGLNNNLASAPIDTSAQYLYVYMTYNGENNSPNNSSGISQNTVVVGHDEVTSFGAIDPVAAGLTGRSILNMSPTCPYPAPPVGGTDAARSPCNLGVSAVTITTTSGNPANGGTINGLTTDGPIYRLYDGSSTKTDVNGNVVQVSDVQLTTDTVLANYSTLLGAPLNPPPADVLQFGEVFYYTSDRPAAENITSIQGAGTADGHVLSNTAPEPAMLALLGGGLLLLGWSRRTRRS